MGEYPDAPDKLVNFVGFSLWRGAEEYFCLALVGAGLRVRIVPVGNRYSLGERIGWRCSVRVDEHPASHGAGEKKTRMR